MFQSSLAQAAPPPPPAAADTAGPVADGPTKASPPPAAPAVTEAPAEAAADAAAAAPRARPSAAEVEAQISDRLAANAGEIRGLFGRALQGDTAAIVQLGVDYVWPVLATLLLLVLAFFVARVLSRWVSRPLSRKIDPTIGSFFGKLVFYAIMVSTLLGVLGRMGISVASFAAVVAALGFAVGLAFQGTLSNFASGLMLLVFRPFKVGDVVNAAGITAKVAEIDLFSTKFDTFDNRRILVPNSDIFGSTIENVTFHRHRRADISLGTAYAADLDDTRRVLGEAVESVDGWTTGDGYGYQVFLKGLGDSAINWDVRVWYHRDDFWSKKEALIRAIKNHLDAAGIGIPFPQQEVWLRRDAGAGPR